MVSSYDLQEKTWIMTKWVSRNQVDDKLANEITYLIVVISPASLKSQWASYEIGYAKVSDGKYYRI